MQIMKKLRNILVLALAFFPVLLNADKVALGKAVINYESGLFSSEPSVEEKAKAVNIAKSNAILEYAQTLSAAQRKLFELKRAQFLSNPDRYLSGKRYVIVRESVNSDAKTYSVVVQAYIDVGKIDIDIGDSYGEKNATPAQKENKIAIFCVARSISKSRSFDATTKKTTLSGSTVSGSKTSELDDNSVSASETATTAVSTGSSGYTELKTDKNTYIADKTSESELESTIRSILSESNVKTQAGGRLKASKIIRSAYNKEKIAVVDGEKMPLTDEDGNAIVDRGSLESEDWEKIEDELNAKNVKIIAVCKIDFDIPRFDSVSGCKITNATVSIDIFDISGDFDDIAVEPKTLEGVGDDDVSAKKSARSAAAKRAANEIVAKLRLKGLL